MGKILVDGMRDKLSAVAVRKQTKPGMHGDGGGLYLRVTARGWKGWIFRYRSRTTRKLRDMGLGAESDVSLSKARALAAQCRAQLAQGKSPIEAREAAREAEKLAQGRRMTFAEAARQCHAVHAVEFRNAKHRADWLSSLERYAFPVLGKLSVADVTTADVLRVLQPNWATRTETLQRTRQRIETVLDWATVSKHRQGVNPARWKGNLKELLPKPDRVKIESHHPALPWREVPVFMAELAEHRGMAALALRFAILTAARSGEVRGMRWRELEANSTLWTVPAERMKRHKLHRVPLSAEAADLIAKVPRRVSSEYVFAAPRSGGELSDMSLSVLVRKLDAASIKHGGKGWRDPMQNNRIATPHGIARSCFKDWARSCTAYPDEVSELQLAHVSGDTTRAAYARNELLAQRRRLMADWAAFCREGLPETANVTSIGRKT